MAFVASTTIYGKRIRPISNGYIEMERYLLLRVMIGYTVDPIVIDYESKEYGSQVINNFRFKEFQHHQTLI